MKASFLQLPDNRLFGLRRYIAATGNTGTKQTQIKIFRQYFKLDANLWSADFADFPLIVGVNPVGEIKPYEGHILINRISFSINDNSWQGIPVSNTPPLPAVVTGATGEFKQPTWDDDIASLVPASLNLFLSDATEFTKISLPLNNGIFVANYSPIKNQGSGSNIDTDNLGGEVIKIINPNTAYFYFEAKFNTPTFFRTNPVQAGWGVNWGNLWTGTDADVGVDTLQTGHIAGAVGGRPQLIP